MKRFMLFVVSLCLFLGLSTASAGTANPTAKRELIQPDGSRLSVRLSGDAWDNYYETLDGYTLVANSSGYWTYAISAQDGGLTASPALPGFDNPPSKSGLRPEPGYLAQKSSNRDLQVSLAGIDGVQPVVIVLIDFPDSPGGEGGTGAHDANYFTNLTTGKVLGAQAGNLNHYLSEISYSQLSLTGTVATGSWVTADNNEIWYGANNGSEADNLNGDIGELVREAVQKADAAGFDFAPFDDDSDGIIDRLMVVHAGDNQSTLAGSPDDIWSRQGSISGGEIVDGVTAQNYMLLAENDAMSAFAQEFMHDMGAPDLVDNDGDSTPVGPWCLMGQAWETEFPPHPSGFLKVDIDGNHANGLNGWVTPTELSTQGVYNVDRLDQNPSVFWVNPAFSNGERFLVENRQRGGIYDNSLPESGLIFTHLDQDMPDGGGGFNDGSPTNTYHSVYVERPGNLLNPLAAAFSSDDGEDHFGLETIPNTYTNQGLGTNYVFRNVGSEGSTMSFEFKTGLTDVPGSITSNQTWALADSPFYITSEVTVADGVRLTIEPGVVVKFASNTGLNVNGSLIANGLPGQEIIFTSYRDDSYAGDTNGNGPTSGSAGDWYRISMASPDEDCEMSYCVVRYAGAYRSGFYQSVALTGSAVQLTMDHCTVENGGGLTSNANTRAIYAASGATLLMTDCLVRNHQYTGVLAEGPFSMLRCRVENATNNWGVYASANNVVVRNSRFLNNGNGLYLGGSNPTATADTTEANSTNGLQMPQVPLEFNNCLSNGNGAFGFLVAAEVVESCWTANTPGINGRNNAIYVYAGSLTKDETWLDDYPYYMNGQVTVPDGLTMTVEAGSLFRMASSSHILIQGRLMAQAALNDTTVFTSYRDDAHGGDINGDGLSSGSAGDWKLLYFSTSDDESILDYCKVLYAGRSHLSSRYISIGLYGNSRVTFDHCLLAYTEAQGYPSYISAAVYADPGSVVHMSGSVVQNNGVYGLFGGGSWVLDSCIVSENSGHGIYVTGPLQVSQTQVMNNGGYPNYGPWGHGIFCSSDSVVVTDCRISNNQYDGLTITGAYATVINDTLDANTESGLVMSPDPLVFTGNLSTNNGDYGYEVSANYVDNVWNDNQVGTNGRGNAIRVTGGNLSENATWVDAYPFALAADFTVNNGYTLALEPGAILKFDRYRQMKIDGVLVAQAAEGDTTVFTSHYDDNYGGDTDKGSSINPAPGDWKGLNFYYPDVGSELSFCKVRFGGYGNTSVSSNYSTSGVLLRGDANSSLTLTNTVVEKTSLHASSSYWYHIAAVSGAGTETRLEIADCVIRDNMGNGLRSEGDLTVLGTTFSGNNRYGMLVDHSGARVYDNIFTENTNHGFWATSIPDTFAGNWGHDNLGVNFGVPADILPLVWQANTTGPNARGNAVGITGGTVGTNTTWIDDHPYYVTADVIVADNVALTLEPGSILKFETVGHYSTSGYQLVVYGSLHADGAQGDEIVFTSATDDVYGGDTNGNGPSDGVKGDWSGLRILNPEAGTRLNWGIVRYAGHRNYFNSSYHHDGLSLEGSGAVMNVDNSIFEFNGPTQYTDRAVNVYSGATMYLNNCTFRDNDNDGLYADGLVSAINCTFENNGAYGVNLFDGNSVMNGNTIAGNGNFGVLTHPNLVGQIAQQNILTDNGHLNNLYVIGGVVSTDAYWPNTYGLVVAGEVTVANGTTVQIQKGETVKFNGSYGLTINGQLVAIGDPVEKVVFTSYLDDAYGGDTNENGINSSPAKGDWRGLTFNGAGPASDLEWAVLRWAGSGSNPALEVINSDLDLANCVIINSQDRGVRVGTGGLLEIHNSDIYGNAYGLENLSGVQVDARQVFWGDASGPLHLADNPGGQGNQVSDLVLFDPFLTSSMDNPWVEYASPSTAGNYNDAVVIDFNGDAFLDVVAATDAGGFEIYSRTGFETWQPEVSPVSIGQVNTLNKGDVDGDLLDDFLMAGAEGIRVFLTDAAGSLTETNAPLMAQSAKDAHFAFVNHDAFLDIVGCSGDNQGVYVFLGDGAGSWTVPTLPSTAGSYNRIETADLNHDTWLDIIATSAEDQGVQIWYGAADGSWTAAAPISNNQTFHGLAVVDVNKDGHHDLVVSSVQESLGLQMYMGDGAGNWTPANGPTSVGFYNDVELADLNGDGWPDLVAASQGGGVHVWVGTASGAWNFWYHPNTSNTYIGLAIDDFTLNGTLDLIGASNFNGLSMWENLTPGNVQQFFVTSTDRMDFGSVALGTCAHQEFTLSNDSFDTLRNVVIYATSTELSVTLGSSKDIGPVDMLPGEAIQVRVEYCPVDSQPDAEAIVIHSTTEVTSVRITGSGVDFIAPIWAVDLNVSNAVGGPGENLDLVFGAAVGATDSLEVASGEAELPPSPPAGLFDARFQVAGTEGSLINVHDFYNVTDSFRFQFQAGSGGYPVTISWDPASLPAGTFLIGSALQDTLNMGTIGEYIIPVEHNYISELTIWSTKFSTHTYQMQEGWQLVSRPVDSGTTDLPTLFPSALSAWGFDGSYTAETDLFTGVGYWVNVPADTTVSHTGNQVRLVDVTLDQGWNLVGALADTYLVADILTNPPGILTSAYGLGVGYQPVTEMIPGQGYWVNLSQAGQLTMDLDSFNKKEATAKVDATEFPSVAWAMPLLLSTVESSSMGTGEVTIGMATEASAGLDPELGETLVPPVPPSRVFEARLLLAEGATYYDLRSGEQEAHYSLRWQGEAEIYPLTLSWDPALLPVGTEILLTDPSGGSLIPQVDMMAQSSLTISENQGTLGGVTISVKSALSETGLPRVVALYNNLPNPFNPSTTIRFALPSDQQIRLRIYDVAGRLVRTLADEGFTAGTHDLLWNGKDQGGAQTATGVYFYRLETQDKILTRKMLLIK